MNRKLWKILTALLIIFLSLIPLAEGKAISIVRAHKYTTQESQRFTAQNSSENVELLGQLGGAAQTIHVRGLYAYAGFGTELDILDISNPAQIQRVGWLAAEGEVLDISINGDYAYIAYRGKLRTEFGPTGLQVVDISHPDIPVSIADLKFGDCGSFPHVIASGSDAFFAYTACEAFGGIIQNAGAYLYRLDISIPTKPNILVAFSTPTIFSEIQGIAVGGNQVYAIFDTPGAMLKVFDVSTLSELVETGSTPVSDQSQGIALAGNYAFLAAGADGLEVVDVSDLNNPVPAITFTLPSEAQTILIDGATAYIGTSTDEILLVDISDPLSPVVTGSYGTTGQPLDIGIYGTSGYAANGSSGLEVFDIAVLSQLGSFLNPDRVNEIAYNNPYAYLAADNGFWVLDVSNPRAPTIQAHLITSQPAVSLVLADGYAYVACPDDGLHIMDISNPTTPFEAGTYAMPIELNQLALDGNMLYTAAGTAGMSILSINNPLAPQEIGSYTPLYGINRIAASGRYVYIAADNGNLVIVDVSDLSAPEEMGIYDPPNQLYGGQGTTAISVQNNTVFLATIEPPPTPLAGYYSGDVWFIDVSNPEEPTLVYQIVNYFGWAPEGISLGNNRLHVAYERQGLHIYDITDLAAPMEIGSYEPPEFLYGVTNAGDVNFLFNESIYTTRYIDPNLPSINGWITHPNHKPKPGVLISTGDTLSQNISDLNGAFSLRSLSDGIYTIIPTLSGYVFSPTSRTVSISPSAFSQNFTILAEPVSTFFEPGVSRTLAYTDTQGLPTWLEIPADASDLAIHLTIIPSIAESAPGYAFTGHAFELNVQQPTARLPSFTFNTPVTLTVQYSLDDVAVISDTQSLALWWWNDSSWQDASHSCTPASVYSRDTESRFLSLPICQSGVFKLIGPTNQVMLPIIMRDQ